MSPIHRRMEPIEESSHKEGTDVKIGIKTKGGMGRKFLNDEFNSINGSLKNGNVLHVYFENKNSVAKTIQALMNICGSQLVITKADLLILRCYFWKRKKTAYRPKVMEQLVEYCNREFVSRQSCYCSGERKLIVKTIQNRRRRGGKKTRILTRNPQRIADKVPEEEPEPLDGSTEKTASASNTKSKVQIGSVTVEVVPSTSNSPDASLPPDKGKCCSWHAI